MILRIDPKVDYAFKKTFGTVANLPLLHHLLESVLKPSADERLVQLEICNPFNEKELPDDKLSILDIKARDQAGRQYNIEMEMTGPRVYPHRALYYWGRLHSGQLSEGDDYSKLRPTISISFVDRVLFPEVLDYHLDFQLRSRQHPSIVLSSHLAIHLVELPKFRLRAEELKDPLEKWIYFLIHGAELDQDNLPASLLDTPIPRAMEVLNMMTQSELERDRYESRLKAERDYRALVYEAEHSLAEGLARGESIGLAKGEIIGHIHFAQRVLGQPLTLRGELLAKTLDELQSIASRLQKAVGLPQ